MPLANELALISRYDHPVVDLDGDASQGPAPPRRGKDEARRDWAVDPECYTLAQGRNRFAAFFPQRTPFPSLFELLLVAAMPIHDAVDLARFLVETTNGLVKFSVAGQDGRRLDRDHRYHQA